MFHNSSTEIQKACSKLGSKPSCWLPTLWWKIWTWGMLNTYTGKSFEGTFKEFCERFILLLPSLCGFLEWVFITIGKLYRTYFGKDQVDLKSIDRIIWDLLKGTIQNRLVFLSTILLCQYLVPILSFDLKLRSVLLWYVFTLLFLSISQALYFLS